MKSRVQVWGLDIHAKTIAVAIAEPDGEVRSLGALVIFNQHVIELPFFPFLLSWLFVPGFGEPAIEREARTVAPVRVRRCWSGPSPRANRPAMRSRICFNCSIATRARHAPRHP
jgi:hypothetical protein